MEPDSPASRYNTTATTVSSIPVVDTPFNGVLQPADSTLNPGRSLDQSSVLDEVPLNRPDRVDEPTIPPRARFSRQRLLGVGLLLFGVLAATLLGIRIEVSKSKNLNESLTSASQRIKPQSTSLTGLSSQLGSKSTVSPTGSLTVNGSLVLAPSVQPSSPVAGQLFYNGVTNQVQYYDGTGYVKLQGGNVVTNNAYDNTTVNNTYGGGTTVNNFYSTPTSNTYVTDATNVTNNITNGASIQGTAGTLAMFGSGGNTLANSLISQSGTTVTVAGTTDTIDGSIVNVGTSGSADAITIGTLSGTGSTNIQGATLVLTSDTTTTWGINGTASGAGGSLTLQAGTATDGASNGGNLTLQSGSATNAGASGNISINTGSDTATTGGITIESGSSSTTASGNVTVDTGSGYVSGTVVEDDGFENGTDGIDSWVAGTTATQNCTVAHTGSCSLAVAGPVFWGVLQDGSTDVSVTAGHHYFITAWVRAATGSTSIAAALMWNVGGFDSSYIAFPTTTSTTTGWTEMTASGVAPAGATLGQFRFGSIGGSSSNGTQYFDDITTTDLSSSSSASELSLGATNAQIINIGNMNEIGPTTIDGGSGLNMNAGSAAININGGAITVNATGASSIGTDSGSLTLGAGGGTGGGIIVQPQSDSQTAFQIQNSVDSALFTADTTDMIISITGTTTDFATLTVSNAHFSSTQTTPPTITTPTNCGSGAAADVTAGSTDSAGSFTISTGSGSPTTCDTSITFNQAYGTAPKSIILTPAKTVGGAVFSLVGTVSNISSTAFTVQTTPTNASASTIYSYYYWVVE
jgi:hypothetical protein